MMMKKTGTTTSKRSPTFPKKLYHMLENAKKHGYENLISWMPDSNSFKIHVGDTKDENEKAMFVKLLKQYFNQTKYDSFLRQLMLYNFERIYKGPQRGVCKHVLFMEGRPDLFHKKSIHDFQQQKNTTTAISPIIPTRLYNLGQPDYNNSKGKDSYDDEDSSLQLTITNAEDEDNNDDDMHSYIRQSEGEILDEDKLDVVLYGMPVKSFSDTCGSLFDETQEYEDDINDIMSIVYASEINSSPQLTITDAELELLLNHI
jgi:hypothetical protein